MARKKNKEKRQTPRWVLSQTCIFDYRESRHEGKLGNLSMAGAFVESSVLPSLGTQVEVHLPALANWSPFSIGDHPRIAVEGVVVHHTRRIGATESVQGFGVRFSDLDENARQEIEFLLMSPRQEVG